MIQDYFALFGITAHPQIDVATLENRYQTMMARLHPDKNPPKNAFEEKQNMMMVTTINEAYRVLKDPVERCAYLLRQRGIDAFDPHRTHFSPDFLMQQLEWRETLDNAAHAADAAALTQLAEDVTQANLANQNMLNQNWQDQALDTMAEAVGRARFLEKLLGEIARQRDVLTPDK